MPTVGQVLVQKAQESLPDSRYAIGTVTNASKPTGGVSLTNGSLISVRIPADIAASVGDNVLVLICPVVNAIIARL